MAKTCDWKGASGTKYTYDVHSLPIAFEANDNGNYIYTKVSEENKWVPIFIGEGDLSDSVSPNHHQADCIKAKGATHVHTHLNDSRKARKAEESDLLGRYINALEPKGCNEKPEG